MQIWLVCWVCLTDPHTMHSFYAFLVPGSWLLVYICTDSRSHLTLLLSVSRYFLSYIAFNYYSSSAQVAYRLAFISAAATYGIVVYKGHIARGRLQGTPAAIALKLITDENVQYLGEYK